MTRLAPLRIGALTAVVLLMVGCTQQPIPMYTELDRPQTDSDLFPDDEADIVDAETIRLVGELDGRSFYLGLPLGGEIEDGICILVAGESVPDGSVGGCTGPDSTTGYPFGDLKHNPSWIPDSALQDGWVRISDNLIFKPEDQPYAELSREQTETDVFPIGAEQNYAIDVETVRLVGTYGSASFTLAQGTSPGGRDRVCVIAWAYSDGFGDGIGCGTGQFRHSWPGFGTARYSPTPIVVSAVEDGWLRISENLIFEPAEPIM